MKLIHRRDIIRSVREKWNDAYRECKPETMIGLPGQTKAVGDIRAALDILDLETCSASDVAAAMTNDGWVSNCCSECGADLEVLVHIGDEPDYDAKWQDLCGDCLKKALDMLPTIGAAVKKG